MHVQSWFCWTTESLIAHFCHVMMHHSFHTFGQCVDFLFCLRCNPCLRDQDCVPVKIRWCTSCVSVSWDPVQSLTLLFIFLLSSPRVHWGAGLFPLLEGTPGGCTWRLHYPLCWSPFWYLWTSRSLPWLSTGKSTNSRLVYCLKVKCGIQNLAMTSRVTPYTICCFPTFLSLF